MTENEMNYLSLTSENSILASSFCFCGSLLHVSMFFLLLNQLCFSLLFFLDFLGNLFDLLLEVGGLLIQSRSGLQRNIESVRDLNSRLGILNQICFKLKHNFDSRSKMLPKFVDFLGNLFDLLLEVGGLLIQSRPGLQRKHK